MGASVGGSSGSMAQRPRRSGVLLVLTALTLVAGPLWLRPDRGEDLGVPTRRLVILSPHNERVREEFGRAFAARWKAVHGETVTIDWRIPGGSSEIALFLRSEFSAAFANHWRRVQHRPWTRAVAAGFLDPRIPVVSGSGVVDDEVVAARGAFLASDVGIGVDLLFGGGAYDFDQQAEAGFLVAGSAPAGIGLSAVIARHPDWFNADVLPDRLGGERFRDPGSRWTGVVLATFGIAYNRDVLRRLGRPTEPRHWSDLADPRLLKQVALADPSKSGSVAKAFELIIQQQMHREVAALSERQPELPRDRIEYEGVRKGWLAGLRLIQAISANARYFTDSASKIVLEIARGDAAAGMAIDSYGRATEEFVRRPDGSSRVGFVNPVGGTSLSVDSIALLRGAPEPELATAFIEFVLSAEGQKLWAFRPGVPGGPAHSALRRMPIRRDFYVPANRAYMADAGEQPYAEAGAFTYRADWTGRLFNAIRFLVRVLCVDYHREQQEAWRALIASPAPDAALQAFHDLDGVGYDEAINRIAPTLSARDRGEELRLARALGRQFRERYRKALQLARPAGDRDG